MLARFCVLAALTLLIAAPPVASAGDGDITIRSDLDGDHEPEVISIVRVGEGQMEGTGQYAVRVAVGGVSYTSGSYEATGPVRVSRELPEPVQALQELPEGPLAVADLLGDGRKLIVAQLHQPISRLNVLTLILWFDSAKRELTTLFDGGDDDGLLCMRSDDGIRTLLIPWGLMVNGCPAFPNILTPEGDRWKHSVEGLPKRLAWALVSVYGAHNRSVELRADMESTDQYVRALLASGDAERAAQVAAEALWGLDEAEKQIPPARRDALLLLGQARVAQGLITDDTVGAIAAFEKAFDLEPAPGFETARGFALFQVCLTRMAANDWEGANTWLTEAEEAEGQPDKFAKFRETIPLP